MSNPNVRSLLFPLLLSALVSSASAQGAAPAGPQAGRAPHLDSQRVTFRKLFATGDRMPGYPDTFNALGVRASLHDGQVAFQAFGGSTQTTVLYRAPASGAGVAVPIVDSTMTMPNGTVPFRGLSVPIVHAGECVFSAKYFTANPWGIYLGGGGPIEVVIDRTSGYQGFVVEGFDGENVAFGAAQTFGALWLQHKSGGPLRYVATSGDPLPGASQAILLGVREVFLKDGWLAFSAFCQNTQTFDTFYSIVRYDVATGALETLVGEDTQVPGQGGVFTLVTHPTIDGDSVLFAGNQGNPGFGGLGGLYRFENGGLSMVVDTHTMRPDGSGTFGGFQGTFIGWRSDGPSTIFSATDVTSEPTGIYRLVGGVLTEVVQLGDRLGGRVIDEIDFWHEGYDAGQLVFRAGFEDGTRGLWVATLQ